ncbi:MAG: FAD-dependent oxidoreductase, partial [Candidatus Paceibacterota bacterium]
MLNLYAPYLIYIDFRTLSIIAIFFDQYRNISINQYQMEANNNTSNDLFNNPFNVDIIIIGSGPAAFTAGIYAARANKTVILLEGQLSPDIMPGGQLTTTTEVENFPGFPDGIDGFELVDNMRKQAIKFGTNVISETVITLDMKSETNKYFK